MKVKAQRIIWLVYFDALFNKAYCGIDITVKGMSGFKATGIYF
jgi:hypothetical protein